MFRKSLDRFSGMLFVYDHEQEVNFSKGVLKNAHRNAIPFDLTNIYGGNSIQYVLEINAGMFDKLGIKPNSEIRYPLIDQELAIWKC